MINTVVVNSSHTKITWTRSKDANESLINRKQNQKRCMTLLDLKSTNVVVLNNLLWRKLAKANTDLVTTRNSVWSVFYVVLSWYVLVADGKVWAISCERMILAESKDERTTSSARTSSCLNTLAKECKPSNQVTDAINHSAGKDQNRHPLQNHRHRPKCHVKDQAPASRESIVNGLEELCHVKNHVVLSHANDPTTTSLDPVSLEVDYPSRLRR